VTDLRIDPLDNDLRAYLSLISAEPTPYNLPDRAVTAPFMRRGRQPVWRSRLGASLMVAAVAAAAAIGIIVHLQNASVNTPRPAAPTPKVVVTPTPSGVVCQTTTVPQALQGTWTVVIRSTDHAAGGVYGAPPGLWSMTFTACTLEVSPPTGPSSDAVAPSITANQFSVPPDPTCGYQVGTPSRGIYTYTVTGSSLTFRLVSDSCLGRSVTFAARPWQRQ
jgi:hypothetical protein